MSVQTSKAAPKASIANDEILNSNNSSHKLNAKFNQNNISEHKIFKNSQSQGRYNNRNNRYQTNQQQQHHHQPNKFPQNAKSTKRSVYNQADNDTPVDLTHSLELEGDVVSEFFSDKNGFFDKIPSKVGTASNFAK